MLLNAFRERATGSGPRAAALFAAALLALALSSTARAAIIVGSDLTENAVTPDQASNCAPTSPPCTNMLTEVKQDNQYPASSPARGTVTAFDIKSGGAGTVTFRLLHLDAAVAAKVILVGGVGTGPTVELPGPGTYEFPVSLPIAAGDSIGFDSSLFTAYGACQTKASSYSFSPPLIDAATLEQPSANGSCELLINAVVSPSAAVAFGKGTISRRGRASLGLRVPGPGDLALTGRGIKPVSKQVGRAGLLNLPLVLVGSAPHQLANRGRVTIRFSATFTPSGGSGETKAATIRFHR